MADKEATVKDKGPMVMVYIGDDDPSRGDSHGFKGIGMRMAQKLHGEFHYLENRHLVDLYPDISRPRDAFLKYLKDHGKPDIMLSRYGYYGDMMTSISPRLIVSDINERLSDSLLGENSLVSHHLTPELLEEQGKQFRDNYKEIKTPLVAVMMVNLHDIESFAQKMVSKGAAYEEGVTVFICTSPRTHQNNYAKLKTRLEELAAEKGLSGKLHISGYNFHEHVGQKTFNPYVGLIQEADHVVVAGESMSMVSEPLASGKPVYLYEPGHGYSSLKKKGLAIDFNTTAADTRFNEHRIKAVNITEDITDRLIDKFNKSSRKHTGLLGWVQSKAAAFKNTFGM
ncbi:MAG: mitochondrial fission ELM1 family protein [Alphaproteobacteria bacterium]|nr:mitochondrial fission ELM1 family protein [Alphaproteobacteria bacterium]